MKKLKFTNVTLLVWSSKKKKLRPRAGQNHTVYLHLESQKFLWDWTDDQLINSLPQISRGRVYPSSTTKVIRK